MELLTIKSDDSLRKGLEKLNKSGLATLFVVDDNNIHFYMNGKEYVSFIITM